MKNFVKAGNEEDNENKSLAKENSTLIWRTDRQTIEMQFCLKQQNGNHHASQRESLFICFRGFKATVLNSPVTDTGFMKLHICFNATFLEAVTGEDCHQTFQFLEQISVEECMNDAQRVQTISPQMRMIITELLSCDKSGTVKRLFWQSKILELLMLQIEQIEDAGKPISSIKYYDIEKLLQAKSIVENNLITPYSLKALGRKVGLNDFKLKRGFKELFGYTVFGYLHELRMQKAKKLLLTGKDSVTDIAWEVGYQHPHHFSAAFKKRFGVLPGALNKQTTSENLVRLSLMSSSQEFKMHSQKKEEAIPKDRYCEDSKPISKKLPIDTKELFRSLFLHKNETTFETASQD